MKKILDQIEKQLRISRNNYIKSVRVCDKYRNKKNLTEKQTIELHKALHLLDASDKEIIVLNTALVQIFNLSN